MSMRREESPRRSPDPAAADELFEYQTERGLDVNTNKQEILLHPSLLTAGLATLSLIPKVSLVFCTTTFRCRASFPRRVRLKASMATPLEGMVIPEGFTLHKENSAYLLLPSEKGAFLNTIQEFNRDLSVACIHTWTERFNQEKLAKLKDKNKHPARKKRRLSEYGGVSLSLPF